MSEKSVERDAIEGGARHDNREPPALLRPEVFGKLWAVQQRAHPVGNAFGELPAGRPQRAGRDRDGRPARARAGAGVCGGARIIDNPRADWPATDRIPNRICY
jgi:hypothetical protein